MYQNILKFKGTWRNYQQRVLNRFEDYKSDGKIHIVAAPGSGKTTLGIELIRRLDQPALILVPTITIRQQWIERIKEAFLNEGVDASLYLSEDLKDLKLIAVSTYQAIHSAMSQYQGIIEEDENEFDKHQEEVDYHDYHFLDEIKKANIGILCLDECHHLRSEWWKALETLKKQNHFPYTIALTATPPYDSSIGMWNRYIDMCGEIDEEITVPELVKEGSLCPHQDYVYFNYPTSEETKEIRAFEDKSHKLLEELMNDITFQKTIQTHTCLFQQPDLDTLLDKPQYLSAVLIFLEEKGLSYPKQYQEILGYQKLEKMSLKWMEILLQGLLFDDHDSYAISEEYQEQLLKRLKSQGFIEKNQVLLQMNQAIEKMLVKSVGKCESIKDIVFHEYGCLKQNLRLLILTDYIRKEYEKAIGNETMDVHNLGVLPFFELLRREALTLHQDIKLGVLCGTMVIIPKHAKERLTQMIDHPSQLSFDSVGCIDEYVKVNIHGDQHFIVDAVSQLFEEGYMQVLIGTKSLLGEGWDSPCVNTLILASFVGSFMLSNQMRGRAIRTFIKDPQKTSHIWHLVCVDPQMAKSIQGLEASQDFQTLSRRMEHFLGLHYQNDVIENGIERLTAIRYPLSKHNIKITNKEMFKLSQDRTLLKQRWDRSLAVYDQIEVVDENQVQEKMITAVILNDAIRKLIILIVGGLLGMVLMMVFIPLTGVQNIFVFLMMGLYLGIFLIGIGLVSKKVIMYKNPLARLKICGDGILNALRATNQLESYQCLVKTERVGVYHVIYLAGGTGHDKTLFAKCVYEFFDAIDNQRYILYQPIKQNQMDGYFVIPEIFSKRKEDAEIFAQYMRNYIGKYQAIYTRSLEGRKILLNGRIKALANKQDRIVSKKKVKGALE